MKRLTWENIAHFDDIISNSERDIIIALSEKNPPVCPHLRRPALEKFFFYCGVGISEEAVVSLEPSNTCYQAHQGVLEIQLYCAGDFKKCHNYPTEKSLPSKTTPFLPK